MIPEVCEAGSYVDSDGTFSDVMLLDPGQLRYVLATKMFEQYGDSLLLDDFDLIWSFRVATVSESHTRKCAAEIDSND